jgi:stage II sporulation protein D
MVSPLRKVISYKLWVISLFIFLFLTHNSSLITHHYAYAQAPQYIRVAIVQDAPSIRLKVNGFYEAINSGNNEILLRGRNLNTTVTVYRGGILLGNIKSDIDKLLIKPNEPDAVVIDGRMFRGNIQLIKKDNSHLSVINHIELEDYIKGILYHESSHYWPQEALKAQAIACRTFALYQTQENALKLLQFLGEEATRN